MIYKTVVGGKECWINEQCEWREIPKTCVENILDKAELAKPKNSNDIILRAEARAYGLNVKSVDAIFAEPVMREAEFRALCEKIEYTPYEVQYGVEVKSNASSIFEGFVHDDNDWDTVLVETCGRVVKVRLSSFTSTPSGSGLNKTELCPEFAWIAEAWKAESDKALLALKQNQNEYRAKRKAWLSEHFGIRDE